MVEPIGYMLEGQVFKGESKGSRQNSTFGPGKQDLAAWQLQLKVSNRKYFIMHHDISLSAITGPSKAEVDFEDRYDGSCHVTYKVQEPGDYSVGIRFNDTHIPGSPYRVSRLLIVHQRYQIIFMSPHK